MSRSHPPGMALPESRARTSPRKCATGEVRNLISPRSVRTPFALSDAPPLQLRQELPLTTISQLDTRDIVWCNAPKYEGRVRPQCCSDPLFPSHTVNFRLQELEEDPDGA